MAWELSSTCISKNCVGWNLAMEWGEGASQSLGSRILPVSLGFQSRQLKFQERLTNFYMKNWFKWWPNVFEAALAGVSLPT